MPAAAGDLAVETNGIAPIPADNRYGTPWRLFTVWFAPNLVMSAVFTGSLGIVLGLNFTAAVVAVVVGTVIGAAPVAYLGTWGPRTGAGQLPLARLAFGRAVVLPGLLQWGSSICWDALVGLFGGDAVASLFGIPFWLAAVVVLALQGVAGVFGYEIIHRVQQVMSVVLAALFGVLTVKLALHGSAPASGTVTGTAAAGAFVLFVAVTLSTAISWATYASDFSRYLPVSAPRRRVFWLTLAGLVASYVWMEVLGVAAASALTDQTATGVRSLMGGGALGAVAMAAIGLSAIASNAMNDYSGSLALQTVGVRFKRPVTAVVVTAVAFVLILWLHGGDFAEHFENVLLFIGYWIPPFIAVVGIDWYARTRGGGTPDLLRDAAPARGGIPAAAAFLVGFAAAVPFMDTSLFVGPAARSLAGADLAFYVGFAVTAAVYAPLRLRGRGRAS